MRPDSGGFSARLLIAPLLWLLAPGAQAQAPTCPRGDDWPAKIRLEYEATASRGPLSISGESVLLFERSGTSYTISVETDSAIYQARQTSRGTVERSGLQPVEYVESRTRRPTQTTTFDWKTKRVSFSAAPEVSVETQPGLQDRASLMLHLVWRQRRGTDPSFEVPVAGSRRVSPYRFTRHGVENVKVPVGVIEAVKVERPGDDDHDRIEAWLGSGWCGLPVRIRYTERRGGVIDHRMRAARIE
jgi:Protein of unknown function (DUF3108)